MGYQRRWAGWATLGSLGGLGCLVWVFQVEIVALTLALSQRERGLTEVLMQATST
jgi:hypothetical protein